MNNVLRELDRHNRHDEAARADALAEQTIRQMGFVHQVSPGAKARMRPFLVFAAQHGVSPLPARCEIVAAFILFAADMAAPLDGVMSVLEAIEDHHDSCGLPNPVKSAIVAQALDHWPNAAPRSWGAPDRVLFLGLPSEAQRVITRRENERDKAVQRKFEDVAKARKGDDHAN